MKILIVADQECKRIWDYYQPGMLKGYDLILSAGDLSPRYLSFLVTMASCPVMYIHGNHDDCYETLPPEGCDCIDGKVVNYKGLRIFGLGGSMRYNQSRNMYTPAEMHKRIRKAASSIRKNKGFDILLTHSPMKGFHDSDDLPHQGFEEFRELIEKYRPRYFIHGHNHKNYSSGFKRVDRYLDTTVINAWETYELEIPDEEIGKG